MPYISRDNKQYYSPYAGIPGYENTFTKLVEQAAGFGSDSDANRPILLNRINNLVDDFKRTYSSSSGKQPTNEEIGKFLNEQGGNIITGSPLGRSESDQSNVNGKISEYISSAFPGIGTPTTSTPNPPSVPPDLLPLPPIPGLSNPTTPVNAGTVPTTDISPYVPTTSQQQQDIINNGIAQSQSVANQNVQSLQDILGPYVQSQVKNWTDPNSPDYQSTIGALNNVGRADAGTFGQSLSSRLAPLIGQNMMSLGTNALAPSFQNQQNLVGQGAGTQSSLGLASLQRFIDQQNFQQQAALANQLADKGQPSNFQQGIGGASSILGGLGNLGQGIPGFKQLSWICTHLKNLKLATEEEVEAVHARLYPSIFKHPLEFIHYLHSAPRLIELCDVANVDWEPVKCVLIDKVLSEHDSEKAWQIYRTECKRLALRYAPELWTLEVIA